MAVNTWAVSVMRYGAGILKWTGKSRKFDNAWSAKYQK